MGRTIIKRTGRVELFVEPCCKEYTKLKKARKRLRLVDNTADAPAVQAEARKFGIDAIHALNEIIANKLSSDVARISAAQTLLDRAYGRPTQTNVNATVNTDGAPSEVTEAELNRRIAKTLTRVESLTKRKREKIKSEEGPVDLRKLH